MLRFKAEGHNVISLTQNHGTGINPFLQSKGIKALSYIVPRDTNSLFQVKHLIYFVRFCKREKIDIVFSHLDSPNFIASIGQYFIRAKVYLCRHHIDEAALYQYDKSWTYKLINLLAKKIIVVSKHSMDYMIHTEKVEPQKLVHINLAYDFSLYDTPDSKRVAEIRATYGDGLLFLTVCRLTRFKRPELSIAAIKMLKDNNVNCRLIILGEGEMKAELKQTIHEKGLDREVILLGHVPNVLDYLKACDFLLHPSILESSCVVVKEAGIVQKPVIVCQHVGDFDDYILDRHNGFSVDSDKFPEGVLDVVTNCSKDKTLLSDIGSNLSDKIVELFDIGNVFPLYKNLLS